MHSRNVLKCCLAMLIYIHISGEAVVNISCTMQYTQTISKIYKTKGTKQDAQEKEGNLLIKNNIF